MTKSIRVLSPDGFDLFPGETYKSEGEAWKAFNRWKKRYEGQGYYSSNKGRIMLVNLSDHIQMINQ